MASRIKDNVISLSRLYDAPLQAVWDAWTQPDEVAQWWGPARLHDHHAQP
jgi:uncharacterized protein YndB with AHSA1/START domain